jgi:redox-sensitive bicupin YhaK (pirin superfamily)
MGVIHSERPPQDIHERGGRQEIIQLWINSPASLKMDPPSYFPVQASEIPKFHSGDQLVVVNVIAGDVLGLKGPVPVQNELNAATIDLKKSGKISIPLPQSHNSFIYILNGKLKIEGYGLTEGLHAVVFANDGEGIAFEALEDTRVLLMTGKPLNEKVVAQGPFVMNSQTEIMEAMRDYQMGKMGVLIED